MSTTFTAREPGTVLAALRYWQRTCESDYAIADCEEANDYPVLLSPEHFDGCEPLSMGEIDELCMRLNCEATGEPDDPARDIEKPEPEGSHKIEVYIPVCVEVRVHADGRLEALRAAPDPEGSPFPNLHGEVYAHNRLRDEDPDAEEFDWRDGTEDELMTADAYVSAALSAWR